MVILMIAPVIGGLLVGCRRGGRLRHLVGMRFRALAVLWLVAGAQLVGSGPARPALVFGLAGFWLVLNLRGRRWSVRIALLLILVGGAMNAAVIAANGAMPYRSAETHTTAKHVPMDAGTRLAWLADIIPCPPLRAQVSVGDLVLFVGIGAFVAVAMMPERPGSRIARNSQAGHNIPGPQSVRSNPHG
jgi:hypothetical protein